MSSIVGIVDRDGAPLDPRLLRCLTATLASGGPDAQRLWLHGPVGFGHAWLRTSEDGPPDAQPLTLDGRVWITADARIDARGDLVRALAAHGGAGLRDATDAALILRAYRAWGEGCVSRLLGDFAFAIWDVPRQRLFCARDHFGVKPFFYAVTLRGLVLSSSLACVLSHPAVSRAPDDEAIGDFLRVGELQDPAATAYAAVRRLPAAHALTVVDGRVRTARYWRLPVDGEVRYRRHAEYVEHYAEVLERAVDDRLRCRRAGVLMSGGLDSTTVAATAARCLGRSGSPFELRAYTTVRERIVADPERRYAPIAADALSMPIHYRVVDAYQAFERWDKPELRRPEPEADPLLALHVDQLHDAAAHGRVLLTGYGGDPAVRLPVSHAVGLLARGHVARLAAEVGRYIVLTRRLPRVRARAHLRRWLRGDAAAADEPPAWLTAGLRQRPPAADAAPVVEHPTRREAYELLVASDWPSIFEGHDAGVTGVPIETRHPLFDRRVVEYLLAIPPMPWCFDKTIMRLAMRGLLPDAVRLRPKSVAVDDPLVGLLQAPHAEWIDRFEPTPALRRYVDRDRVPRVCGERDAGAVWTNLRPLCLDLWLRSQDAA